MTGTRSTLPEPDEGAGEVEWVGSRLAAPGPGEWLRPYGDGELGWYLFGVVLRVSPADSDSIKVRWNNGRITIERRRNLQFWPVMAVAA